MENPIHQLVELCQNKCKQMQILFGSVLVKQKETVGAANSNIMCVFFPLEVSSGWCSNIIGIQSFFADHWDSHFRCR